MATWDELGGLALARQFPEEGDRDEAAVVATLRAVGPVQSQTARSPFLGLGARLPGLTHAAVTAAYESFGIVRGSTVRGTVHTAVPEQFVLLEQATRIGQLNNWLRTLRLEPAAVHDLWAATEDFARDEWRTPAELLDHLKSWVSAHGGVTPESLDLGLGRYLAFGHGGLVRRPLKGRWDGQGAPAYRTATALVPALADPQPLDALVRVHLAAHGPASRYDLAWWSGLNLTVVDEVLARLDLPSVTGPDGRAYVDLPAAPRRATSPACASCPSSTR